MIRNILFAIFTFLIVVHSTLAQDRFERQYRSFSDEHFATSMTAIGTGYGILSTQLNEDGISERVNVLSLDEKGKINWSNTYEYDDTVAYVGEITRLSNGSLAFSTILDKDSLNKVITVITSGGSLQWTEMTGQLTDMASLPMSRSLIADVADKRIFHAHTISSGNAAGTDVLLSSYAYNGDEQFTRRLTIEGQSFSVADMIPTIDSAVLIVGQIDRPEAPLVLVKIDTIGNLLWTKSYKNAFDRLEVNGSYRITELVDTSYVIVGTLDEDILDSRAGFVLRLSDTGEVISADRFNNLNGDEEIYTTNVVGLLDTSVVVSIKRQQDNDTTVVTSLINFNLDSAFGYQTSLDTLVFDMVYEDGLVSVDSSSASYLNTRIHPETEGLTPYIAKVDRVGSAFCHESVNVVGFDSVGWLIVDTLDIAIDDFELFADSTEVSIRAYGDFDPPNRTLQDTTYCPNVPINYTVDATVRGGVAYIWDDGNMDSIRTFTEEGMFMVTMVVREDICFELCDTVTIMVSQPPMVSIQSSRPDFCETGEIVIGAQAEGQIASFMWEDGSDSQLRRINGPGTYRVMVVDNCDLTAEATIVLTENDFNVVTPISVTSSRQDICTDGSIILSASTQDIEGLVWSTGAEDTRSIRVTEPGTYTVTRPGEFCREEGSIELVQSDFDVEPSVELSASCSGNEFIAISATGENLDIFSWSTGSNNSVIAVTEPGTYSVNVTGPCGDEETAEIEISEDDIASCIISPPGEVCLRWPNVFLPRDNEAINTSFGPRIDCDVDNYELHIYNRWGQEIWSTNNPQTRWNGMIDNDPAPGDVYHWWARYGDEGAEIQDEGDVTLIR